MGGHAAEIAALLERVDALEAQAVLDRTDIEHLHVALDSARQIGAGVGVVMTTIKVTEAEAFELLKHVSQNTNQKLRELAAEVVRTGAVPTVPPRGSSTHDRAVGGVPDSAPA